MLCYQFHRGEKVNRPTLGTISTELLKSAPASLSPIDIQRETEKEYLDNLVWAVEHARKKVDCSKIPEHESCKTRHAIEGDFYITAILKREKLLTNVLRNYFIPTVSCPTPTFDQTLYKFNSKKEEIEFLWVVPDKETCEIFRENIHQIVPQEQQLLDFIIKYYDGTLFYMAKRLNGETDKPGNLLEKE
jgi:hypothetical protein